MLQYEIFVDHGETPNRCTILPLAYRPDFHILRRSFQAPLQAEVLLHHEGIPLDQFQGKVPEIKGLAAIDCIWRRLDPLLKHLPEPHPIKVRIPEGFVTAYPRVSKKDFDPEGGLATIEAIFIGAAFLGVWDLSLLREYYFAEAFLEANRKNFEKYGIAVNCEEPVYNPQLPKNSRTRRLGRGKSILA